MTLTLKEIHQKLLSYGVKSKALDELDDIQTANSLLSHKEAELSEFVDPEDMDFYYRSLSSEVNRVDTI